MDLYNIFMNEFDDFLLNLRSFIKIPSVSNDKEALDDAVLFLHNLALSFGLDSKIHLDKKVLTVEIGEGDETFGVLSHLDVVPVILEEWKTPPFDLTNKDGILYGRGVVDDKGPTMMILYIMKMLKSQNIKLNKKMQLIVGTQEEVEWVDMDEYVAKFKLPDYGFTPDGSFPVQNAEKGYADFCLVFPKGNITDIDAGVANNSIPSNFYCVIDGVEYTEIGATAHSSTPAEGVSAVHRGILKIGSDKNRMFEFIEKYLVDYLGRNLGIYEELYVNDNIPNQTTLACTKLKMVDDKIHLTVNFRTARHETSYEIIKRFEQLSSEYDFTFECLQYMSPVYVDKSYDFINIMQSKYEEHTFEKAEYSLANCATYAKAMPNFVSFGPLFPLSNYSLHKSNEEFKIDELLLSQQIYIDVIYEILTNNKSFIIV